MTPDADVDVVVIGFGMAGATAALSAASAGARVLALDAGAPNSRHGRLRAAALDAGVRVRAPFRAHELVTEAGRVCGVGYATLPPGSLASAGHQCLRRMSDLVGTGRSGAGLCGAGRSGAGRSGAGRSSAGRSGNDRSGANWFGRAAQALWAARFVVGEVRCSAVVLAIGSRHWDFVSAATWSATRVAGTESASRAPGWLSVLPAAAPPPTPELTARRWLASREGTWRAPRMGELRVDALTGAVLVDEGQAVPGLYSAVPVGHGLAREGEREAAVRAGRAAYGAVITAQSWARPWLSSAG